VIQQASWCSVQHLKLQAKETHEEQKEHAEEVSDTYLLPLLHTQIMWAQNQLQVAGEILRASMMHGHKKAKCMGPSTPSSDGESTKENTPADSLAESSGEMSKRTQLTSVSHVHSGCEIAKAAHLIERNDDREECKEKKMDVFHASLRIALLICKNTHQWHSWTS
jgi:hypothetical protein